MTKQMTKQGMSNIIPRLHPMKALIHTTKHLHHPQTIHQALPMVQIAAVSTLMMKILDLYKQT